MNVVVLGGGPAGRTAAIRLAQEGCSVRLVESGGIGGQCLHYGCMSVCGLNEAARVLESSRRLADLGVVIGVPRINFAGLLAGLHRVQQQIAMVLDKETRHAGVEIVYGERARLHGKSVLVGNEVLEPQAIVASTGSIPFLPPIPGIELPGVFTPHSLPNMQTLPEKLAIIGGSVMAAEFAYIFRCFGSEVSIIARSGFLKDLDPHLRRIARRELEGINVSEHTRVTGIFGDGAVRAVATESKEGSAETEADAVFVAAGLVPRTGDLHGIEKGPLGEVRVDEFQGTNVPGVYAAGDVTGPPYLTPVARAEGYAAAENILGRKCTVDHHTFPQALNLTHELACSSRGSGTAVSIAMPGPAGPGSFWSVPYGDTGITKIVFEPDDGRLTGVAVAGPGAGIAASYLGFLIQKGVTVHDFDTFRELHPVSDGMYGLLKFASYQIKKGRWHEK
jgi:dihydrolipoamide dehydrogenase